MTSSVSPDQRLSDFCYLCKFEFVRLTDKEPVAFSPYETLRTGMALYHCADAWACVDRFLLSVVRSQ